MTAPEKLNRWLVMSVVLHVGLAAVILFAPSFFPFHSETWGSANSGEGMNVKIVSEGVSGMALPAPEVTTENAAANDSKGFYKSEPTPPAPPPEPEKAEPIPEKAAPVPKKAPTPPKSAPPAPKSPPTPPPPENAVPYGQGGNPNIAYGQFATQNGGVSGFGDGAFGTKYGEYVQAMIRRISQNWIKGLVDSHITKAPRVYVSFDIGRDGKISNVSVKQSSTIPSLDNSAMRAIYASNPLQPLPRDYSGTTVSVTFYFEYIK